MLKNTRSSYGSVAKSLHWLIFLMIACLLAAGFSLDFIADKPTKISVVLLHKSFGMTLLALVIVRMVWALANPKPVLPVSLPRWQKLAATGLHYVLYALMLLMPLSGWMMSTAADKAPNVFGFGQIVMPFVSIDKALAKWVHGYHTLFAWILIAAVSLHILAALKHHYLNKDDVLKRMLPW